MTHEQRLVFGEILNAVIAYSSGFTSPKRMENASLFLPGGRTAHSRFLIPIIITDESNCNIKHGSLKAEMLIQSSLIIWDDAPMLNKMCFKALDQTLRNFMSATDQHKTHQPFGGKVVVLGSDFRQILLSKKILAPTLENIEKVNDFVLTIFPRMEKEYLSSNTTCQADENEDIQQAWFTSEFLNDIKCLELPNHKLTLKSGVVVMLLQNIDQTSGLCNGTRLIVNELGNNVIGETVVTGRNIGDKVYIPRMNLIPSDSRLPFKFQQRQFLLTMCFAMTINKSQGQSLSHVGLYLPKSVFTHGQLYVALSRVKSRSSLKVLILDKDDNPKSSTTNVIFKEVFNNI
ncbi:uncharacterized protein LOC107610790 [Arachis ipaensis]|uniref:uncharacterized protein LOC107610790 n=1 Tax=Arachis ipaensis TaxID=130454 RepID=UPI0007AF8001|nr:uncharacterized protein LOC107610790 [Arachis ipaensis]